MCTELPCLLSYLVFNSALNELQTLVCGKQFLVLLHSMATK